ncbi:hypothetical protein PLESTB_000312700 [Pleodorina starrii]|uniref:Translation initiation factor eIF2B subunit beta n=1 Tax=Pleodorina starrii TaxID=330485 RepID=A0A9W6BDL0_9CHLO|nr:hypothetical protein PLESTM_001722600 [Pleodorina starrii]GLC49825.1 hypothetical protein PLESTB_000312700 [Pleodorina starrii]GLC76218.1 hypothetical protein PLESTF_001752000 [Pleodorina starrii]
MSEKKEIDDIVEECCTVFRRRQIEGSLPCAKKTLDILRLIVTNKKHSTAAALIDEMRTVGYKMQTARPVELAIGNMVRRVLHIIREEAKQEEFDDVKPSSTQPSTQEISRHQSGGLLSQALKGRLQMPRGPSLSNLLDVGIDPATFASSLATIQECSADRDRPDPAASAAGERVGDAVEAESQGGGQSRSASRQNKKTPHNWKGKHEVIESINELIDELDHIQGSITAQGVEHIHANEVILTMGMSDTTLLFLKEAAKKREFQVVVAEGAPRFDGHLMARKLADAGIQTTLIADSAVYAMMARANKVLVGAHAVLANGGVVAPVGLHMVALSARRHSIPFVVLVGLHKLSPLFPTDPDLLYNEFKGPADVIDFDVVGEAFVQQQQLHIAAMAPAAAAAAAGGGGEADAASGPGAAAAAAAAGSPALDSVSSVSSVLGGGGASGAVSALCPSAPTSSLTAAGGAMFWDPMPGNVHVPTPLFDYVPPHLISLFITDMGGRTPSYVYRLLTEYYSRDDYFLSREVFGKDGAR